MERGRTRDLDGVVDTGLSAGTLILQNGGETYRAEETMISIATSLGAESASAFVTPTVVMLSCRDESGESRTRIQRVASRTINLGKIARVNEVSRRLARGRARGIGLVSSLLSRIDRSEPHRPVWVTLATAVASMCFSLLFNGSPSDALVAFAVGAAMRLSLFALSPLALSPFISAVSGGAVVSLLTGLAVMSGAIGSSGNVSISVLMSLVPGVAIVNAIRDIISGDLVAGSARVLEAFVIAAGLSIGAAFGLYAFASGGDYSTAILARTERVSAFILAFGATAAFAYFFHINRYDIFWASLFGGAGWLVYLWAGKDLANPVAGFFAGALFVGLCAEFAAILFRKPATVYIVPGIIPFVPGGGMYETMLLAVQGDLAVASAMAIRTLSQAAAIAVGVALASSLSRLLARMRLHPGRMRTRSAPV